MRITSVAASISMIRSSSSMPLMCRITKAVSTICGRRLRKSSSPSFGLAVVRISRPGRANAFESRSKHSGVLSMMRIETRELEHLGIACAAISEDTGKFNAIVSCCFHAPSSQSGGGWVSSNGELSAGPANSPDQLARIRLWTFRNRTSVYPSTFAAQAFVELSGCFPVRFAGGDDLDMNRVRALKTVTHVLRSEAAPFDLWSGHPSGGLGVAVPRCTTSSRLRIVCWRLLSGGCDHDPKEQK